MKASQAKLLAEKSLAKNILNEIKREAKDGCNKLSLIDKSLSNDTKQILTKLGYKVYLETPRLLTISWE